MIADAHNSSRIRETEHCRAGASCRKQDLDIQYHCAVFNLFFILARDISGVFFHKLWTLNVEKLKSLLVVEEGRWFSLDERCCIWRCSLPCNVYLLELVKSLINEILHAVKSLHGSKVVHELILQFGRLDHILAVH
jgi:hypothetical protein